MKRQFALLVLVSFAGFLSCQQGKDPLPDGILPPDSMVLILADFHLAESLANDASFTQDAAQLRQSFYKYILSRHQTDFAKLKASMDYYAANPELFQEIYEKVITELSRRQAEN